MEKHLSLSRKPTVMDLIRTNCDQLIDSAFRLGNECQRARQMNRHTGSNNEF